MVAGISYIKHAVLIVNRNSHGSIETLHHLITLAIYNKGLGFMVRLRFRAMVMVRLRVRFRNNKFKIVVYKIVPEVCLYQTDNPNPNPKPNPNKMIITCKVLASNLKPNPSTNLLPPIGTYNRN
jgi:hypothetical protein